MGVKTINFPDQLEVIASAISEADCRKLWSIIDDFTPSFQHLRPEERERFEEIKKWLYNEKPSHYWVSLGVQDYNSLSREED